MGNLASAEYYVMDKVKQPLAVTSKINADSVFNTPGRPV